MKKIKIEMLNRYKLHVKDSFEHIYNNINNLPENNYNHDEKIKIINEHNKEYFYKIVKEYLLSLNYSEDEIKKVKKIFKA